jgi:Kef-type K+ transport system membrane component KefB
MISERWQKIIIITLIFADIIFFLLTLLIPYIPFIINDEKWKEITKSIALYGWSIWSFVLVSYGWKRIYRKLEEERNPCRRK